jgi:hypothetical protein
MGMCDPGGEPSGAPFAPPNALKVRMRAGGWPLTTVLRVDRPPDGVLFRSLPAD